MNPSVSKHNYGSKYHKQKDRTSDYLVEDEKFNSQENNSIRKYGGNDINSLKKEKNKKLKEDYGNKEIFIL